MLHHEGTVCVCVCVCVCGLQGAAGCVCVCVCVWWLSGVRFIKFISTALFSQEVKCKVKDGKYNEG